MKECKSESASAAKHAVILTILVGASVVAHGASSIVYAWMVALFAVGQVALFLYYDNMMIAMIRVRAAKVVDTDTAMIHTSSRPCCCIQQHRHPTSLQASSSSSTLPPPPLSVRTTTKSCDSSSSSSEQQQQQQRQSCCVQIVEELFPAAVRDRLFQQKQQKQQQQQQERGALQQSSSSSPLLSSSSSSPLLLLSPHNNNNNNSSSSSIMDTHADATVLFADLAGFTAWSAQYERDPGRVFLLLETLYQAFDALAAKHGVCKVETVGDAYLAMIVGGSGSGRGGGRGGGSGGGSGRCRSHPSSTTTTTTTTTAKHGAAAAAVGDSGGGDPRHALHMAEFAQDMMRAADRILRIQTTATTSQQQMQLRIGIHSGPLVTGVLRGTKSRFQIFGDTVNTAARMESLSRPGRIQVSQAFYQRWCLQQQQQQHLQQQHSSHQHQQSHQQHGLRLRRRSDTVVAKGKGPMTTYWLENISDDNMNHNMDAENCCYLPSSSRQQHQHQPHAAVVAMSRNAPHMRSLDELLLDDDDDDDPSRQQQHMSLMQRSTRSRQRSCCAAGGGGLFIANHHATAVTCTVPTPSRRNLRLSQRSRSTDDFSF